MWFAQPKCPQCGARARGIIEQVPVVASIGWPADDEHVAHYESDADEAQWDRQAPLATALPGHVLLCCRQGHEWPTAANLAGDEPVPVPVQAATPPYSLAQGAFLVATALAAGVVLAFVAVATWVIVQQN